MTYEQLLSLKHNFNFDTVNQLVASFHIDPNGSLRTDIQEPDFEFIWNDDHYKLIPIFTNESLESMLFIGLLLLINDKPVYVIYDVWGDQCYRFNPDKGMFMMYCQQEITILWLDDGTFERFNTK